MNDNTLETLYRVEHNDDSLKELVINSAEGFDFNRLGRAIATNSNITILELYLDDLDITGTGFYDGLKQNTSIDHLLVKCDDHSLDRGVAYEILQAYQENGINLTNLNIIYANLHNGGATQIATTLQYCTNLMIINLYNNNITADQLVPMIEAMREIRSLEELLLNANSIGNAGCQALATLLEDPNCNICRLQMNRNNIRNEGVISLVNSLASNTKLKALALYNNPISGSVEDDFVRLLCNTTSINATYSSNHTLELVECDHFNRRGVLVSLLDLNGSTSNKSHVAMKKILRHHPNIDMEPLFGWDMDDEWTLKALPYVVEWFDKAWIVKESEFDESHSAFVRELRRDRFFSRRTLSSIYEFAKAMPLRFVPTDHVKSDKKKRKRVN